jgi:hypothetical protein
VISGCLDEDAVLLLLEGKLSAGAHAEVEAHLDGCETCRRLVGAAAPSDTVPSSEGGAHATDPQRGTTERLGRGASIGRYLVLSLLGQRAWARCTWPTPAAP